MCQTAEATTGEHKWPASYLRRIPEPWNQLQHGNWDGDRFHTQGVRSQNLMLPVLCANCNNSISRNQDRALDAFLQTVASHEREVIRSRAVDLSLATGHDPLDIYRALLKLEFSRLYDDGIPVPDAVADFVSGGTDWRTVNGIVRVQFRIVVNLLEMGFSYPSDSDAPYYEQPYFITHQINFGWLGVHYLFAPDERPELPWPEWCMTRAPLRPCMTDGRAMQPPY